MNSPADKIDLRRGDIITKINGIDATENLFYEKAKQKDELTIEIERRANNTICSGSIKPREYLYSVVKEKILKTEKNNKVAYLRVDSFLGEQSLKDKMDTIFNRLKKENIDRLIIDLRYNGGGSIDLASNLIDKLSIKNQKKKQFTLAWNSNYQSKDKSYYFKLDKNALDIKQLIFLTTKNTASASELIISAMKPYLSEDNLVIIGDRTHGKPVGMEGRVDGSYYYFIINFVVKNALGFYDYFNGLPVTDGCDVPDDPFHEMGDPNEIMLKTAINYIDNGTCQ